ncbi:IQ domain-containing protein IQM2-like [Chenopodium quinoa]|uniref:IQ domain-containing protein IQM2-like n=1 Tax=Chenopodium quinoa TaxID=63459 RepID=UPI000B777C42|nr:IQ domain-containing protein IQM2-like [Chenopodium quinoa]
MIIEGSFSFKQRESDTLISVIPNSPLKEGLDTQLLKSNNVYPQSPVANFGSPKDEAAVKLQKVYKSFCTRRKLADCAVLVEQSWWKLLDFAELKRSSISFFDVEHNSMRLPFRIGLEQTSD